MIACFLLSLFPSQASSMPLLLLLLLLLLQLKTESESINIATNFYNMT